MATEPFTGFVRLLLEIYIAAMTLCICKQHCVPVRSRKSGYVAGTALISWKIKQKEKDGRPGMLHLRSVPGRSVPSLLVRFLVSEI